MQSLKSLAVVVGKFGVAGAVLCVVAWVTTVIQPDGSIQSSEADILDLNLVDLSKSARFARGLEQLGHDTPQTFSINGNVVHFSVNHSRKRPQQLMREYQEEFVYQDLSKRVWTKDNAKGKQEEIMLDAMGGAVVPLIVNREYVSMGGTIAGNDATTPEELVAMLDSDLEAHEYFQGHHFIEMYWDHNRRETTVTASWSGEKFDYRKMTEKGRASAPLELDTDTEVPACPGCTRVTRVRDLDPSRTYSSNVYSSTKSADRQLQFYREAMLRRGWEETDSSQTYGAMRPYVQFDGAAANMLQFSRGGRFLTITAYPSPDGTTSIHTAISQ